MPRHRVELSARHEALQVARDAVEVGLDTRDRPGHWAPRSAAIKAALPVPQPRSTSRSASLGSATSTRLLLQYQPSRASHHVGKAITRIRGWLTMTLSRGHTIRNAAVLR